MASSSVYLGKIALGRVDYDALHLDAAQVLDKSIKVSRSLISFSSIVPQIIAFIKSSGPTLSSSIINACQMFLSGVSSLRIKLSKICNDRIEDLSLFLPASVVAGIQNFAEVLLSNGKPFYKQ